MTDEIITSGQYESRNKGKKKQYLHSFQKQGDDTFNLIVDKQSYEENRKQVLKEHTDKDTQLIILQEALDKKNDEDTNKLFQDFSQVGTGRERTSGGTGLGLAISKKIIQEHYGKIDIESEYGRGSTFSFFLPVKERRG